jgi:hypothetical protein
MAQIVRGIFAFSIVLFVAACATTTVALQENKNPAFTGPLTKLFVEVDVGDWKCSANTGTSASPVWKEIPLGDYLTATLEKTFREYGIETKAIRLDNVNIDQDQAKKEISDFGATKVMEVQLSEAVVTPNRYVLHGIFDVSIHDIPSSNYWRAKITADGGKSYIFVPVAIVQSKVIDSIISALQNDGLLKQSPTKSN